jgi:hypothetical protein
MKGTKSMKKTFTLILAAVGMTAWSLPLAHDAQTTTKTAKAEAMSNADSGVVSVRYIIGDVDAAVAFYTKHFGFTVDVDYAPTFASVSRGNLRLLLSGEKTSGRKAMKNTRKPLFLRQKRHLPHKSTDNAFYETKPIATALPQNPILPQKEAACPKNRGDVQLGSLSLPSLSSVTALPRTASACPMTIA